MPIDIKRQLLVFVWEVVLVGADPIREHGEARKPPRQFATSLCKLIRIDKAWRPPIHIAQEQVSHLFDKRCDSAKVFWALEMRSGSYLSF